MRFYDQLLIIISLLIIWLNNEHKLHIISLFPFRGYLAPCIAVFGKYSFAVHIVSVETTELCLPLYLRSSQKQHTNEWLWPYASRTRFMRAGGRLHLASGHGLPVLSLQWKVPFPFLPVSFQYNQHVHVVGQIKTVVIHSRHLDI